MDIPSWAYIPWFAWIAIAGIVVGGIIALVSLFTNRNKKLEKALEQNVEINEKLIARLDGIDHRLGSVEKTLNEIP